MNNIIINYNYFVESQSLHRWLNIHPSQQGARICFDYDCCDNQVQLKGYINQWEAVQVPSVHSAGIRQLSNAFQVALTGIAQMSKQRTRKFVTKILQQGAQFFLVVTLDYYCTDSQAQLQVCRNQLEAVQVTNIHSAGCSLFS